MSAVQNDKSVGKSCFVHIMGNENYGNFFFFVQLNYSIHYFFSAKRVKHCGRFIQHYAFRLHSNNTGNCNTLLLTSGKLMGRMLSVLIHIYSFQSVINSFSYLLWFNTYVFRSECHIFFNNAGYELIIRILQH